MRHLAIIIAACLLTSPAWANRFIPGSYTLLLFNGPGQVQNQKLCFQFEKTGKVLFRNSGTWTGSPGWQGNYAFSSKYLRGYGTFPQKNGKIGVFNFFFDVDTGFGGYDQWDANLNPIADGRLALEIGQNCFDRQ